MGLSSVSIALSSNIPTGLLVDCCCESVSQFSSFQLFVFFGGFSSLNLAGIQQSSRIFIGRGKRQPPQQGRGVVVPQWRRAWDRVEALQAGGCGVGEGLCCRTTRADYIDKNNMTTDAPTEPKA